MENEVVDIENLTEKLLGLINNKDVKGIRQIFEVIPTIDIADACNQFEDISKLANISTLRTLNISNNKIKDISSVYKGITAFYFSGNKIKDISSLSKMTSLTDLVMNNNKIEDITPIQNILINHEFSMEQQEIVRIIENEATGNVEIDLPQVFKASKETNSKVYTENDFEVEFFDSNGETIGVYTIEGEFIEPRG